MARRCERMTYLAEQRLMTDLRYTMAFKPTEQEPQVTEPELRSYDYVLEYNRTRGDGSFHTFKAVGTQKAESAMLAFTYCCTLWRVTEKNVTYFSVALKP